MLLARPHVVVDRAPRSTASRSYTQSIRQFSQDLPLADDQTTAVPCLRCDRPPVPAHSSHLAGKHTPARHPSLRSARCSSLHDPLPCDHTSERAFALLHPLDPR